MDDGWYLYLMCDLVHDIPMHDGRPEYHVKNAEDFINKISRINL